MRRGQPNLQMTSTTTSRRMAMPRKCCRGGRRVGGNRPKRKSNQTSYMLDTSKFISEVESRPEIYDSNSARYCDREAKAKAWTDICEITVPNWFKLTDVQKHAEENILRSKWRNMRIYFNKELHRVVNLKKKSTYAYFDQLMFLKPSAKKPTVEKPTEKEDYTIKAESHVIDLIDSDNSRTQQYDLPLMTEEHTEEYTNISTNVGHFKYVSLPQFQKSISQTTVANDDIHDVLSSNNSNAKQRQDDDDYDKMFLLSLLPILRRIPEDNKVDARIQIQQVLALAMRSVAPNHTS